VSQFEPIVRTLARKQIALSLRIDPISLRAWYCGDDEEEEEEEEKKREEEEEEDEDEDEDEEWKVSRLDNALSARVTARRRAASPPPPASPRSRCR
jgi:ABC-type Zn2+ transport system substrate-binding protein/surface adhesin